MTRRWRYWSAASTNRRIFGAALVVGLLTLGVKAVAFVRDILIAASFGTGDTLDAYLVAYTLPTLIIDIVAVSFVSPLLPTYIQLRERDGEESAQRLFAEVMLIAATVLTAFAALIAVASPVILPVVASNFDADKLDLTRRLLFVLLPMGVIGGIATVWSGILNAGERFMLAAAAPLVVPIASAAALGFGNDRRAIYALAIGVVAGTAAQLLLVGIGLRRQGVGLAPRWHGREAETPQVVRRSGYSLVANTLFSGIVLVDTAMAATLSPGSVALLSYGSKLILPLVNLATVPLTTVVLPYFSRMAAANDRQGLDHTLRTYQRLTWLVAVPVTVAVIVLSEPIIRLLFQRGEFTAEDTRRVAEVQIVYATMIPFFAIGVLIARAFTSIRAQRLLMYNAIFTFVLNAVFDYVLKEAYGVRGIAAASVINYVSSVLVLTYFWRRQMRRPFPGAPPEAAV